MAVCASRPSHCPHGNHTEMSPKATSPKPSAQTSSVAGGLQKPASRACPRPARWCLLAREAWS